MIFKLFSSVRDNEWLHLDLMNKNWNNINLLVLIRALSMSGDFK